MELVNALIGCGTSSGREVNKVEKFGIPMRKTEGTEIEARENCRLLHGTVTLNLQRHRKNNSLNREDRKA